MTASAAPPGAAAADRAAALEIALDEPIPAATSEPMPSAAVPEIALDEPVPAATSEPMPSAAGLEAVAAPATRLRDAVAAARITPEPAPSRTQFDEPDPERRAWNWIRGQRVILSFDPQRPKYELR